MSEPFIGEIRMFGGNFAPRGWALCDGGLLAISQNDALFSLLGTIYGGDGRTTFGIPDLRGRLAIHQGQGPGLSNRRIGERSGEETATLTSVHLAPHSHEVRSGGTADADFPGNHFPGDTTGDEHTYSLRGALDVSLDVETSTTGAASPQAHDNIMPFTCVNYIIALTGIFPSRT